MYLSKFNYVSDYERDEQRLLMNFLSQSADVVDLESAHYFSEKKGTLSQKEKEYIMKRGYLFQSKDQESAVLQELYESELKNVRTTYVVHLDTFDGKEDIQEISKKIRACKGGNNTGSLILYSEKLLDNPVQIDQIIADCSPHWNAAVITIHENLPYFKPLFNKKLISTLTLMVALSDFGNSIPFVEDTELLLDWLVDHETKVEITARLQKKDVKNVKSLINYFIYKGWPFLENFECTLEPEPDEGCIFGYWYTHSDLPREIFREHTTHPQTEFCSMEKWVGINPVHSLIWMGKLSRPSFHFCEASKGLTILTGNGETVPCLKLVGMSGIDVEEFRRRNASTLPDCQDCMYALSCGGGCICKAKKGGCCPPVKELIEVSFEHYFDEFLERLEFYEKHHGGSQ